MYPNDLLTHKIARKAHYIRKNVNVCTDIDVLGVVIAVNVGSGITNDGLSVLQSDGWEIHMVDNIAAKGDVTVHIKPEK